MLMSKTKFPMVVTAPHDLQNSKLGVLLIPVETYPHEKLVAFASATDNTPVQEILSPRV